MARYDTDSYRAFAEQVGFTPLPGTRVRVTVDGMWTMDGNPITAEGTVEHVFGGFRVIGDDGKEILWRAWDAWLLRADIEVLP